MVELVSVCAWCYFARMVTDKEDTTMRNALLDRIEACADLARAANKSGRHDHARYWMRRSLELQTELVRLDNGGETR